MTTKRIELPPKLLPVFAPPRGALRYRGAFGGRGSGKSFSFAKMAAIFGAIEPLRILCTRELQNSIKESFHAELKNAINSDPWLSSCYEVGIDYIRGRNGTEVIFKGLRHSMGSIKSLSQIDICIVEEAEDIPEAAWKDLTPTIRADKSEIWVIWNPKKKGSPTDKRFRLTNPPRCAIAEMNYSDNPWFPAVLDEERKSDRKRMDDADYTHVWDGAYLTRTDAQVFAGKFAVEEFAPHHVLWDGPYEGMDFGFSQDPTTGVKCWVNENVLYIEHEAGKVGLELNDTTELMCNKIPGFEDFSIRADSARPESISYLKKNPDKEGRRLSRIEGVKKGPGSVEDGVTHIKSYDRIIIHPRCTAVAEEFREYSYKVDRLSGDILPAIVDDWNHYIDAIRYALRPIMTNSVPDYEALL